MKFLTKLTVFMNVEIENAASDIWQEPKEDFLILVNIPLVRNHWGMFSNTILKKQSFKDPWVFNSTSS